MNKWMKKMNGDGYHVFPLKWHWFTREQYSVLRKSRLISLSSMLMLLTISLKNESLFTSRNIWHKLCIPASSLRHALINGVLFRKRGLIQEAWSICFVCDLSLFFFFYRFLKRFKGLFLETFLDSRYQHWLYHELVGCLTLLKRPKTESLCK